MKIKQVRLYLASLGGMALLLACTSAEDRAYKKAALSDMILVATVDLTGDEIVPNAFMNASYDHPGRCCRYVENDYSVDTREFPQSPEEIMAVLDDEASFYTITLPDPSDTSLVEPLFGTRMHRHVMVEPQRGCEVVSGVRDGVLRAGVIAHELPITRRAGSSLVELDRNAVDLCVISAALLLHGFPEAEAMDHAVYVKDIGRRSVKLVPDFKKIADREAELLAQREK